MEDPGNYSYKSHKHYCTKYCNDTFSHTYGYVRGEVGAWSGGRRTLIPFHQIFKDILYVQTILYGHVGR